ncbi:dipeptidyl peptidase IV N-terminal region-domain-containing protein [Tuber brumale]|nr:dipeptidyl peptidase IV N-terminal region-domain-containing protein [Tuber brumale]
MKFSTAFLFPLLGFLSISHAEPDPQGGRGSFNSRSTKKLATFADAVSGNFSYEATSVQWIYREGAEDGTYVTQDPSTLSLKWWDVGTNASKIFVDIAALKLDYDSYDVQPSAKHVLFSANRTKQHGYSYSANYYIWSVETKTLIPLVMGQNGDVQYAAWSPYGNVIAYVRGDDLFLWKDGGHIRVTNDGGENTFNEILEDNYSLWFSPDGEYLAYLRYNETGIPKATLPRYMAAGGAPSYPEEKPFKYSKPGGKIPVVTFNLLEIKNPSVPKKIDIQTYGPDNLVIPEVAWVTEKHERVIVRTQSRTQDSEKLVVVDVKSGSVKVVRERDVKDGWLENLGAITCEFPFGDVPGLPAPSYVDISDHTGWAHIYLYPVAGGEPVNLTSGNWEVTRIYSVGSRRVYYQSTERDSTERHIFSVSLNGRTKTPLVDITKEGYYYASFSPGGGYYTLAYIGPNLPFQEFRTISPNAPVRVIDDNASLKKKLSEYDLPKISWSTLKHPGGYELNFMERLPPKFSKGKKYPVLFDIYGGPAIQWVGKTFRQTVDCFAYLGSDPELEYIIVTVDNRGTGNKGRNFRSLVTGQLGKLEAEDQVWAAREYAKRDYVDGKKIVITGASYGGYLTGKVLELDSGAFSLGIMEAPVTNWRFYHRMYVERYMKLPTTNGAAYNASAITKTAGFKNIAGGFIINHGTGDDNVLFQHSAVLVDTLVNEGVSPEKMHVQWFTDSDHDMNFHGAENYRCKQKAKALYDEKKRAPEVKHQWSRREAEKGE